MSKSGATGATVVDLISLPDREPVAAKPEKVTVALGTLHSTDLALHEILTVNASRVLVLQREIEEREAERKKLSTFAYELIKSRGIDRVDSDLWILFNPGGGRTDLDERALLARPLTCPHCSGEVHVSTVDLEECKVTKRWDSPQFKRKETEEEKQAKKKEKQTQKEKG